MERPAAKGLRHPPQPRLAQHITPPPHVRARISLLAYASGSVGGLGVIRPTIATGQCRRYDRGEAGLHVMVWLARLVQMTPQRFNASRWSDHRDTPSKLAIRLPPGRSVVSTLGQQ